ncbi:phage late control D family protein, partial [Escherichia coli 96.0107]
PVKPGQFMLDPCGTGVGRHRVW